ncbi:hypothetical protein DPX16_23393 [Anabarilius grahami]|uniref:Uncharacterized protein n=1 Tax=Anabarilius grahami TaxID=495550 RepID=A0A3N0Y182_ANAGA|nr:hypothetical protein DPX16_23393 [Anabarilius grahami]
MDQTRPRTGQETRCPAFGVYASCPKLFLGRLVGPYAYVYGSCPCRQNQRQMDYQVLMGQCKAQNFLFCCGSSWNGCRLYPVPLLEKGLLSLQQC